MEIDEMEITKINISKRRQNTTYIDILFEYRLYYYQNHIICGTYFRRDLSFSCAVIASKNKPYIEWNEW